MSVHPLRPIEIPEAVIELERRVLGVLIGHPDELAACEDLDAADFAIAEHGIIFREIADAVRSGRGIEPRLIAASVGVRTIADLTPNQYLLRIMADAPGSMIEFPTHVRSVRDAADRRRIIDAAQTAISRVQAASWSVAPATIASEVIGALDGIVSARASPQTRRSTLGAAADAALADINERRAAGRQLVGCTWGLREMDRATLGMARGDYIVLAGRPSMGKSAVALSAALAAARSGVGVAYFSAEMTSEQLALRALTDASWINDSPIAYSEAHRAAIDDRQMMRLLEASPKLAGMPLVVDPQPGLTVAQISTRARRIAREMEQAGHTLGLVVIDHMGLVRSSNRYAGNVVQETKETSNALKPLAKDLGVAVLALCQLNRSTETREDKRPSLADLRWSGSIEEDADTVVGVFREAYHLERKATLTDDEVVRLDRARNTIELLILKQRMGPTKTVVAFADIASNVVRDLERY